MVTVVDIVSDVLILSTALWGQYWRSRAKRLEDTIQFIIEEEEGNERE